MSNKIQRFVDVPGGYLYCQTAGKRQDVVLFNCGIADQRCSPKSKFTDSRCQRFGSSVPGRSVINPKEHAMIGTSPAPAPADATSVDGRADFDGYHGRWILHNRKLRDVLDPACKEWVEFGGATEVRPILGGLGNVEVSRNDGDSPFEGLALRLFDPATQLWRVWWVSTRAPGDVGVPAEGRFTDGRAVFEADEELGGRMGKVRIEWSGLGEGRPHWQQSFSWDGGRTWTVNWIITSSRPTGNIPSQGPDLEPVVALPRV